MEIVINTNEAKKLAEVIAKVAYEGMTDEWTDLSDRYVVNAWYEDAKNFGVAIYEKKDGVVLTDEWADVTPENLIR